MMHSLYKLFRNNGNKTKFLCTDSNATPITAGIIVIGDEILKGNVVDTNSSFITKTLYRLGVQVKKISVIGDSINEISQEVKLFSKKYKYVITTGGIGPTHDDVTFEGVAKAFNDNLVPHPMLVKICSKFYGTNDLKAPEMKLAHIPQLAKLTFGEGDRKTLFPIINVENVYVFPGIPQLLQKAFDILAKQCFPSNCNFYTKEIYFKTTESSIVRFLNEIVKKYPDVVFGSYPEMQNMEYQVRVTIESKDEKMTQEAYNDFIAMIPSDYILKKEK